MAKYDSSLPARYDSGVRYDEVTAPLPKTKKNMAKIKRDWTRLGRADRLALAQTVKTALTGNATYAALNPTAAQFETLRAASAASEQAIKDNGVTLANLRSTATADADALLAGFEQIALSAEGIALGDETKLSTTGFNLTTPGGSNPSVDITQVENFTLTAGDFDGQVDGQCDPVNGARTYNVQLCPDINLAQWQDQPDTPNTQFSITGLTSGQRVWVRMRAYGTKGPGPWSDPATKIVP